jgi:hypothetical protein
MITNQLEFQTFLFLSNQTSIKATGPDLIDKAEDPKHSKKKSQVGRETERIKHTQLVKMM